MDNSTLSYICKKMRMDCLVMADAAGDSGMHFGGTLSLIEIIAVLYMDIMKINIDNLHEQNRDRLILSKGHGVPAIYAVLHQIGIVNDEDLTKFKSDETVLYGHPSMNPDIGIELSTGSLGQGLSQGVGIALALRYHDNLSSRVFVILGDGECDEGSIWEAAMSASKFGLNNLMVIVDKNALQYDGNTEEIMPLASLEEKWKSFGWDVETIDGHDLQSCKEAFSRHGERPTVVIANTIKGKGISFMEGVAVWHHSKMTKVQREEAWREITDD